MSYRSRLLLYAGMLIVLLVGMMTLSFTTARDVIVAVTREHVEDAAAWRAAVLDAQHAELGRYAALLAADPAVRSALDRQAPGEPPVEARLREFSTLLPGTVVELLDARGEVLAGGRHPQLVDEVRRRGIGDGAAQFFFVSAGEVVMVAVHPVHPAAGRPGAVAVARSLDRRWLMAQEKPSGDYLMFFENRGKVLYGSDERFDGVGFDVGEGRLESASWRFRMQEIRYAQGEAELPELWFGVTESGINRLLAGYQRWVLSFAVFGTLVVLLVGWLMVRNFSRPLEALMLITGQMMKGELPVMARSEPRSEMDHLVNRFADMLDCLRQEQSKLESANRRLQETAITDSLTGLYNRRYLQEVTPGLFAQAVRDGRYLTAVLIDLDRFKTINDSLGHLGGDAVLSHFSRLLQHNSRINDFLFRIGGEEFLILNVAESPADSVALAEKIRDLVSRSPAGYQGRSINVTVSIGVSCCYGKSGELSLSILMRAADKALYEAKSSGRNCVVQHTSCRDAARSSGKRAAHITLLEGGHGGKPGG